MPERLTKLMASAPQLLETQAKTAIAARGAEGEWGEREDGLVARAGEVREALSELAGTRGQLVAAVSTLDAQMEGLAGAVVQYAAGLQEQGGLAVAAAFQRGRTAGAASAQQASAAAAINAPPALTAATTGTQGATAQASPPGSSWLEAILPARPLTLEDRRNTIP